MNTEHDLRRRFTVLVEILLNDGHHEFHRGVIVIEQGHLVERRRLEDLPLQQGFCVVLGCHTLILMLSQWLSCAISAPFNCFQSYAFSRYCADGDTAVKIKSCFFTACEVFGNINGKALDFIIYSANNAVSTVAVMYSLIRSETSRRGQEASCFYGSCDLF